MEDLTGHAGLRPSPLEGAALGAVERAEDAARAALVQLLAAEVVTWTGPAARAYRRELERVTDGVRHARVGLEDARWAVAEHAAAVRRAGAMTLPAAGTWLTP